MEKLYVVTSIFNPSGYKSRYNLYFEFKEYIKNFKDVEFYTIELSRDGEFHVTDKDDPYNFQIESPHVLWHKENLLNIAISKFPKDWKYVCWIDADIEFEDTKWPQKIIETLKKYPVIQPYEEVIDIKPDGKPYERHYSFMKSYHDAKENLTWTGRSEMKWQPGFVWACTKDFFNAVGGLIDFGILGSADRHMCTGMIGVHMDSMYPGMESSNLKYLQMSFDWQKRARTYFWNTNTKPYYMPGKIFHKWHGAKINRQYTSRWKMLVDHMFDPTQDIVKDWQGLYQFVGTDAFRDGIILYFNKRKEDG